MNTYQIYGKAVGDNNGKDFTDNATANAEGTTFTFTIPKGESSANLDIMALTDKLLEYPYEQVNIKISNPQGGGFEKILVKKDTADVDIYDETVVPDDEKLFVRIDFVDTTDRENAVTEGEQVKYKISLVDIDGNPVTVEPNGSVTATISWANTTVDRNDVTVDVLSDHVYEGAEVIKPEIVDIYATDENHYGLYEYIRPHTIENGAKTDAVKVSTTVTDASGEPQINITVEPERVVEGDTHALVYKVAYREPDYTSVKDSIVHVQQDKTVGDAGKLLEVKDIDRIEYRDVHGELIVLLREAQIQDFLDNGIDVKITAGDHAAPVISILPKDDNVYERSETLTLKISNPSEANATADTHSHANVTTEQNDYVPETGKEVATGTVDDEDNPNVPPDEDKEGDKPFLNIKAVVPEVYEGEESFYGLRLTV